MGYDICDVARAIRDWYEWVDELEQHLGFGLTVVIHDPEGHGYVTIHGRALTAQRERDRLEHTLRGDSINESTSYELPF